MKLAVPTSPPHLGITLSAHLGVPTSRQDAVTCLPCLWVPGVQWVPAFSKHLGSLGWAHE